MSIRTSSRRRFVVVDNDADESSRAVVTAAKLPWPVVYVVEPERGIPFARNRAVREAADSDFVVFIDDDEIPEPGMAARSWWPPSGAPPRMS